MCVGKVCLTAAESRAEEAPPLCSVWFDQTCRQIKISLKTL